MTYARISRLLIVLLLWPLSLTHAAEAPATPAQPPIPKVHRQVLDNGLTVLLVRRPQSPVIAAAISVRVGSMDDPKGQTGMAHMFEHMAFKGTDRIGTTNARAEARLLEQIDVLVDQREQARATRPADPQQMTALTEQIDQLRDQARSYVIPNDYGVLYHKHGAVGMNATTGPELTQYFVRFPANRLPFWANMEAERFARPVLREFYTERDVVMEERRSRVDSNPRGRLQEDFLAMAFEAHPYGRPGIGWASDLNHLTRTQAADFYARHYVAANMVVSLVGDLEIESTMQLMQKTFGSLPRRPAPIRPFTAETPPRGPRHLLHFDPSGTSLMVGYLKPGVHHPDDPVFDIIQLVLSGGRTGRLYRSLVVEQRLAANAYASGSMPGALDPHLFVIYVTPLEPHTPREAEVAVLAEINRLREELIDPKELMRAVTQVEAGVIRGLISNQGLARSLAYYEALVNDWRYPFKLSGRMARITPERVRKVARTYLNPERRIVALRVSPARQTAPEADPQTDPAALEVTP